MFNDVSAPIGISTLSHERRVMGMADYYIHERLSELWSQIHHLHLTYLHTEDSPQKIDERNRLEACIRKYLYIAPHNQKFYCPETADVLHRSASSKTNFSGYRAALAWNAVSMYAGNLLSQPWRKEYRQIKTYCGFYKHQIEANLVGAEAMFEAMGYKHVGDGILILEDPVCPDRLTNVSQDSIVAFVECQILKSIWEEVGANNFKINWLDVLEFRETHSCSPEQSIRILSSRFHEQRYHQEQQQQRSSYGSGDSYPTIMHRYSVPQQLTGMHSFPPLTGTHSQYTVAAPQPQPQPIQCTGHCIYSGGQPYYTSYAHPYSHPRYGAVPYHQHSVSVPLPCVKQAPCNGYCYPNGCIPPPAIAAQPPPCLTYSVPTGQLIELDTATAQNGHDVTDSASKRFESHKQLAKSTNLDSLTLSKAREDGAGTFESWDYVYRNLENQGYYNKDLEDRNDVLQSKRHNVTKKPKPVDLDEGFSNLNLRTPETQQQQPMKINEALKRFKDQDLSRRSLKPDDCSTKVAPSSSYENISSSQELQAPPKSTSNNLITKIIKTPEKPNHLTTLDPKKLRKQDVDKVKPKELKSTKTKEKSNGWNCNTCTYLNSPSVEICGMCSKSRKTVDVVMAVGGSQCPACTLVNPKEESSCQACGSSLLDSPTYI